MAYSDPGTRRSVGWARVGVIPSISIVDRAGNMISATPSGGWMQSSPIIPEPGFALGTRAQMFWLEENHPASLAPGKRPRTTLSPTLALRDGLPCLAWGSPACPSLGDVKLGPYMFDARAAPGGLRSFSWQPQPRISLSSVRSDTARRSRAFSVSSSLSRFRPPYSLRHRQLGNFGHAYQSTRGSNLPSLRHQHINLPQLGNDLPPYAASLPSILSSIRKSYFREDHFNGGRSGKAPRLPRVFRGYSASSSGRCSAMILRRPIWFLLLAASALHPLSIKAMVGGAPTVRDPEPEVMKVGSRGNSCTGIAIARDLVFTAAHCVPPGAKYKLVEFDAQRRPRLRNAQSIAHHPQFSRKTFDSGRATADVALIKFASPVGSAQRFGLNANEASRLPITG